MLPKMEGGESITWVLLVQVGRRKLKSTRPGVQRQESKKRALEVAGMRLLDLAQVDDDLASGHHKITHCGPFCQLDISPDGFYKR